MSNQEKNNQNPRLWSWMWKVMWILMDLYQIKELGIMAAVVMVVDLEVDDLFFVQRLQVPSGSKICCFCMFFWCCWVILKRKEAWSPDKLLILSWFFLESVIQLFVPYLFSHDFGWERGRTSMFVYVNSSWKCLVASLVTLVTNPTTCWQHDGKCWKNTLKAQTNRMCVGFLVLVDSCSQMAILTSSLPFKNHQKTNRYVYSGTSKGHLLNGIFQGRRWHTPSLHLGPQENRKVSWQLGANISWELSGARGAPPCQPTTQEITKVY